MTASRPARDRAGDLLARMTLDEKVAVAFDDELAAAYGRAVASEARGTGANVLLGPAVDIARVPLGGRLAEAMGEDPYGDGRTPAVNTVVGERALQELYYPPFKAVVQRGGPGR
jgi:beta-glucosidase